MIYIMANIPPDHNQKSEMEVMENLIPDEQPELEEGAEEVQELSKRKIR
jgi:hypothetical protein